MVTLLLLSLMLEMALIEFVDVLIEFAGSRFGEDSGYDLDGVNGVEIRIFLPSSWWLAVLIKLSSNVVHLRTVCTPKSN